MLALGVDVSVARGLDFILLDGERHLVGPPLRAQTRNDLTRILTVQKPDIVAIDSPPKLGTTGGSRPAERELRLLGIQSYGTPSDPEKAKKNFYAWMHVGFSAFEAGKRAGYRLFTGIGSVQDCAIEVFPHGSAVALSGWLPPPGTCKSDGRKRRWRAAILETNGIDTSQLRSTDEVDAALAALTGLFALEGIFWAVGDPAEAVIVLPGNRRSERFPRQN